MAKTSDGPQQTLRSMIHTTPPASTPAEVTRCRCPRIEHRSVPISAEGMRESAQETLQSSTDDGRSTEQQREGHRHHLLRTGEISPLASPQLHTGGGKKAQNKNLAGKCWLIWPVAGLNKESVSGASLWENVGYTPDWQGQTEERRTQCAKTGWRLPS